MSERRRNGTAKPRYPASLLEGDGGEFLQLANERLEVVGIPNCLRLERVDEL